MDGLIKRSDAIDMINEAFDIGDCFVTDMDLLGQFRAFQPQTGRKVSEKEQTMDDLIRREDIRTALKENVIEMGGDDWCEPGVHCGDIDAIVNSVPSAESEKTVYLPDTKAILTARSCVDLAEKVTATFYDEEHEEWTQQTVTIADVLDSVCDDYTILPSADRPQGEWIEDYNGNGWNDYWDYTCSNCGKKYERADAVLYKANFCPNCGADMRGDDNEID